MLHLMAVNTVLYCRQLLLIIAVEMPKLKLFLTHGDDPLTASHVFSCSRVVLFSLQKKKRTLKYKQEININPRAHDDDNALLCIYF